MALRERQANRGKLKRKREERLRYLRAHANVPPLKGDAPRAGAYADDDPELHRRFANGEFDD